MNTFPTGFANCLDYFNLNITFQIKANMIYQRLSGVQFKTMIYFSHKSITCSPKGIIKLCKKKGKTPLKCYTDGVFFLDNCKNAHFIFLFAEQRSLGKFLIVTWYSYTVTGKPPLLLKKNQTITELKDLSS